MAILDISNVNKSFGGLKALQNVNIAVEEGTVHAIIGPNGAGKSTLLNCLVGKLEPDTGSVTFDGTSLLNITPHRINQLGVVRVFQTPEIFNDLTILENVTIPALAKRDGSFRLNFWNRTGSRREIIDEAEALLEDIGLADKKDTVASSMSRGDKRRLELAMCLIQHPKLLLLDEPTAGMSRADTNNTIDLLKRIGEERKITKVIIEHDMHVVFSLAEKITVMAQGTPIVEGAPDDIKGDPSACRKPISEGRTYERDERNRTSQGQADPGHRVAAGVSVHLRHPRLLRRKLYRSGRQLRRARRRDPGAAGAQRRRQDLDAAHHRAPRRSGAAPR
jgi:branched-chain amino acid transport system ATP-binding protein